MRLAPMLLLLPILACTTADLDPLALDEASFDRELERRFQYGPPQPPPEELADAQAGQVADAAYLTSFANFDRSYGPRQRARASRLLDALRADAGNLSHEQFVLRVAEIAALADIGHTSGDRNAFMKDTPRIPLRTFWFADGLFVLYADEGNVDLLGARIDRIDGRPLEDVYQAIRAYRGGTDAFRRTQLIPMLESPGLLQAAGVAEEQIALTLSGVDADGAPFTRRIVAEQRDRSAWVSSTSRLLHPDRLARRGLRSFLRFSEDLPPSLHAPDRLFWQETLADGALYVRIDHNADADEAPIQPFLDGVLETVRAARPPYVVLDMRINGGGDYTKTYAFARALPEAANGAPIYVLTSPWTFSAAITTVAALEDAGGDQVTIVGDEVGDRLDFWAEGDSFVLPNAFLQVHYATGRHVYNGACNDLDQCFWLNRRYPVRVSSLTPDIHEPWTFEAYRNGRDPALDAITVREAARHRR
jgi:hypothetical protein